MDETNREYTNGEITVYWKPKECIHATTCFRELRAVFDPGKRPWINMKAASTDEIIKIVDLCPTNALTYKRNLVEVAKENMEKKIENESSKPIGEVRIMRDGPLVVRGEFKIVDANGKEMNKMKIASFCRCGKSANMPFCDGMHRKIGWASE